MASEIFAAIGSIKAMLDIAKNVKDESIERALNSALADVQHQLLSTQQAHLDLTNRIRGLEAEISSLKDWGAEKAKYALAEVKSGVFVYSLKTIPDSVETKHSLCERCFHNGKKSILQRQIKLEGRRTMLVCHACGSSLDIT